MTDLPRIRYACPDDAEAVADLFREVVAPLAIYSQESRDFEIAKNSAAAIARRMENDPMSVLLAEVGSGAPAGFAIVDDQIGPIWLEWYGVHPDARGRRVGEALVLDLIAEARKRHATKIWCDTRTNNTASMALFEKLGFTRICELKNHWHGQDFYLWERMV